jgi:hypothetical protein
VVTLPRRPPPEKYVPEKLSTLDRAQRLLKQVSEIITSFTIIAVFVTVILSLTLAVQAA